MSTNGRVIWHPRGATTEGLRQQYWLEERITAESDDGAREDSDHWDARKRNRRPRQARGHRRRPKMGVATTTPGR